MYLCTCNNCMGVFEDINPSNDSIIYDEIDVPVLIYDDEGYPACPTCLIDDYLVDNINKNFVNEECPQFEQIKHLL